MAKVKTVIYTTERDIQWLIDHFAEIYDTMRTSKGVDVPDFYIEQLPRTVRPETEVREGRVRIKWSWFQRVLTDKAKGLGYNNVCFHFPTSKRTEWGLDEDINGTYTRDPDEEWEFFVCADRGQKSTRRQIDAPHISQFVRVFLHEQGHGFIHWFHNPRRADVHDYDYNRKSIKSLYPTIDATKWTQLKTLQELLKKLIALLLLQKQTQEPRPSRLRDWAKAIQDFEGWYEPGSPGYPRGSRSYRNNNPGNLRWSPFEDGNVDNFSTFNTYQKGFDALIHQLRIAANGESRVYQPDMTLLRFFEVYAPSSDNNHPEHYAMFVAKRLGVEITTKIKTLL